MFNPSSHHHLNHQQHQHHPSIHHQHLLLDQHQIHHHPRLQPFNSAHLPLANQAYIPNSNNHKLSFNHLQQPNSTRSHQPNFLNPLQHHNLDLSLPINNPINFLHDSPPAFNPLSILPYSHPQPPRSHHLANHIHNNNNNQAPLHQHPSIPLNHHHQHHHVLHQQLPQHPPRHFQPPTKPLEPSPLANQQNQRIQHPNLSLNRSPIPTPSPQHHAPRHPARSPHPPSSPSIVISRAGQCPSAGVGRKKLKVRLPLEHTPDDCLAQDESRTRARWMRRPLTIKLEQLALVANGLDGLDGEPGLVEGVSRTQWPTGRASGERLPSSIDVYLPGKEVWDEYRAEILDEKLSLLGYDPILKNLKRPPNNLNGLHTQEEEEVEDEEDEILHRLDLRHRLQAYLDDHPDSELPIPTIPGVYPFPDPTPPPPGLHTATPTATPASPLSLSSPSPQAQLNQVFPFPPPILIPTPRGHSSTMSIALPATPAASHFHEHSISPVPALKPTAPEFRPSLQPSPPQQAPIWTNYPVGQARPHSISPHRMVLSPTLNVVGEVNEEGIVTDSEAEVEQEHVPSQPIAHEFVTDSECSGRRSVDFGAQDGRLSQRDGIGSIEPQTSSHLHLALDASQATHASDGPDEEDDIPLAKLQRSLQQSAAYTLSQSSIGPTSISRADSHYDGDAEQPSDDECTNPSEEDGDGRSGPGVTPANRVKRSHTFGTGAGRPHNWIDGSEEEELVSNPSEEEEEQESELHALSRREGAYVLNRLPALALRDHAQMVFQQGSETSDGRPGGPSPCKSTPTSRYLLNSTARTTQTANLAITVGRATGTVMTLGGFDSPASSAGGGAKAGAGALNAFAAEFKPSAALSGAIAPAKSLEVAPPTGTGQQQQKPFEICSIGRSVERPQVTKELWLAEEPVDAAKAGVLPVKVDQAGSQDENFQQPGRDNMAHFKFPSPNAARTVPTGGATLFNGRPLGDLSPVPPILIPASPIMGSIGMLRQRSSFEDDSGSDEEKDDDDNDEVQGRQGLRNGQDGSGVGRRAGMEYRLIPTQPRSGGGSSNGDDDHSVVSLSLLREQKREWGLVDSTTDTQAIPEEESASIPVLLGVDDADGQRRARDDGPPTILVPPGSPFSPFEKLMSASLESLDQDQIHFSRPAVGKVDNNSTTCSLATTTTTPMVVVSCRREEEVDDLGGVAGVLISGRKGGPSSVASSASAVATAAPVAVEVPEMARAKESQGEQGTEKMCRSTSEKEEANEVENSVFSEQMMRKICGLTCEKEEEEDEEEGEEVEEGLFSSRRLEDEDMEEGDGMSTKATDSSRTDSVESRSAGLVVGLGTNELMVEFERLLSRKLRSLRQELSGLHSLKAELDSLKRDALLEEISGRMEQWLASSQAAGAGSGLGCGLDELTWRLAEAVKPQIHQLIDLASDKSETAALIVAALEPPLAELGARLQQTVTRDEARLAMLVEAQEAGLARVGQLEGKFVEAHGELGAQLQQAIGALADGLAREAVAQDLRARNSELEASVAKARAEYGRARSERAAERERMEEEKLRTGAERERMEEEMKRLAEEVEVGKEAAKKAEAERERGDKEIEGLKSQLKEREREVEMYRVKEEEWKVSKAEEQSRIQDLELRVRLLEADNQSVSAELERRVRFYEGAGAEREAQLKAAAAREAEVGQQLARIVGEQREVERTYEAELREAVRARAELEGEARALRKRMSDQDEQIGNLHQSSASKQQALAMANQRLSEQERRGHKEADGLRAEVEELKGAQERAAGQLGAAEAARGALEAELARLRDEAGAVSAEVERVYGEVSRELSEAHGRADRLAEEAAGLSAANEALGAQLAEAASLRTAKEALGAEVASLRTAKEALNVQLEAARAANEALNAQLAEARAPRDASPESARSQFVTSTVPLHHSIHAPRAGLGDANDIEGLRRMARAPSSTGTVRSYKQFEGNQQQQQEHEEEEEMMMIGNDERQLMVVSPTPSRMSVVSRVTMDRDGWWSHDD